MALDADVRERVVATLDDIENRLMPLILEGQVNGTVTLDLGSSLYMLIGDVRNLAAIVNDLVAGLD